MNIPEFAENKVEHFEGTLLERILHKNWKCRKQAYEELKNVLEEVESTNADVLKEYVGVLKIIVSESLAAAQSPALECVITFCNICDYKILEPHVEDILVALFDKGFSGKASIQQQSILLFLKIIEIHDFDVPFAVLVSKGLKHKKPKVPPICFQAITKALENFGTTDMPVKMILTVLHTGLESTKPGLKESAKQTAAELARWIGEAPLMPILKKLNKVMQKDLENRFNQKQGAPVPLSCLRKNRATKKPVVEISSPMMEESTSNTAAVVVTSDGWEFMPELNLMDLLKKKKFDSQWEEAAKWNQKVNVLKMVMDAGLDQKLSKDACYDSLISLVHLLIKDPKTHIQVVSSALNVLSMLVNGLREEFRTHGHSFIAPLFFRLKEKNMKLSKAVEHAMDSLVIHHCIKLSNVGDNVTKAMNDRVELVRCNCLSFITRCLSISNIDRDDLSVAETAALSGCGHPKPAIKSAASETFRAVMKYHVSMLGPDHPKINATLKKLQKVNEREYKRFMTSELPKMKPDLAVTVSLPPKEHTPVKKPPQTKRLSKPVKRIKEKPCVVPPKGTERPVANRSGEAIVMKVSENSSHAGPAPTLEEALETLENFGVADWSTVKKHLGSTKWAEEKCPAFTAIDKQVEVLGSSIGPFLDALVVFMGSKTRQYKDSNGNVIRLVFGTMAKAVSAARNPSIGKAAASVLIEPVMLKTSDKRAQESAIELLLAISAVCSPGFVISQIQKGLTKVKAAPQKAGALTFCARCVREFGCGKLDVQTLLEIAKGSSGCGGTSPLQKKAGNELLCALYSQIGTPFEPLALKGLSKVAASTLKKELEKTEVRPVVIKVEEGTSEKDSGVAGTIDNLIPKTDISPFISAKILKDMADCSKPTSWKLRNQALSAISNILEKNPYVEPNKNLMPLFTALRDRINDANIAVKIMAVECLGSLAKAIGPKVAPFAKFCMKHFASCCGDSKDRIQNGAWESLKCWCVHSDVVDAKCVDSVLNVYVAALGMPKGRLNALKWSENILPKAVPYIEKKRLTLLVTPFISCLDDRDGSVRNHTIANLKPVLEILSVGYVMGKAKDALKPAKYSSVATLIMKAAPSEGAKTEKVTPPSAEDSISRVAGARPGRLKTAKPGKRNPIESSRKTGLKRPKTADVPQVIKVESVVDVALTVSSEREQRSRSRLRWDPNSLRSDQMTALSDELESKTSPTLHKYLFSSNMQDLVRALKMLKDIMDSDAEAVLTNIDLIMMWCCAQTFTNNSQVTLQLAQFLKSFLQLLVQREVVVSQTQASIILPALVRRMGDKQQRFSEGFIEIVKILMRLYNHNGILCALTKGLQDKNSKTRVGCLQCILHVLEEYTDGVLKRSYLPLIARQVNSMETRELALQCIVLVWRGFGGNSKDLFAKLGDIDNVCGDLIKQRLRHQPISSEPPRDADSHNEIPEALEVFPKQHHTDQQVPYELDGPQHNQSSKVVSNKGSLQNLFTLQVNRTDLGDENDIANHNLETEEEDMEIDEPVFDSGIDSNVQLNEVSVNDTILQLVRYIQPIAVVGNKPSDNNQAVDALNALHCIMLSKPLPAAADNTLRMITRDHLSLHVDMIFDTLAGCLANIFSLPGDISPEDTESGSFRVINSVVATLVMFLNEEYCANLSTTVFCNLIKALCLCLVDRRMSYKQSERNTCPKYRILQALNMCVLKLVAVCGMDTVACGMVRLFAQQLSEEWGNCSPKILCKLTDRFMAKRDPAFISNVNSSNLLGELHQCLTLATVSGTQNGSQLRSKLGELLRFLFQDAILKNEAENYHSDSVKAAVAELFEEYDESEQIPAPTIMGETIPEKIITKESENSFDLNGLTPAEFYESIFVDITNTSNLGPSILNDKIEQLYQLNVNYPDFLFEKPPNNSCSQTFYTYIMQKLRRLIVQRQGMSSIEQKTQHLDLTVEKQKRNLQSQTSLQSRLAAIRQKLNH
eukprot:TRINITY_DN1463_c0_g2_i1.p1 TRINITY_DN1463_c0_g2~~TRINITY_DN1463_c0_g2_i1.p1  ORF type:complete len:1954 (-),score=362.62 TRINITY_DN1463_c0_g2_i1:571-6432(-)